MPVNYPLLFGGLAVIGYYVYYKRTQAPPAPAPAPVPIAPAISKALPDIGKYVPRRQPYKMVVDFNPFSKH